MPEDMPVDTELVELLDSLTKERSKGALPAPALSVPTNGTPVEPPKPAPPAPTKDLAPINEPASVDVIQNAEDDEVRKLIGSFVGIRDEILGNYRNDRTDVDRAISKFRETVEGGGEVTTAVVEGYVNALKVKADINSNAIRMLDAVARFLAAGKGTNIFVQNQGISAKDLDAILNAPAYPDEVRRQQGT
jgi:hypothetical protein